jgi:ankyrin repeat protein
VLKPSDYRAALVDPSEEHRVERKEILKKWINTRVEPGCQDRNTLQNAALHGDMEVIRFLIAHGADINITDNRGNNVLHSAAERDAVQVLYYFHYKYGMDVDARDSGGNTPLHIAAMQGNAISLKYLTSLGADLDIQNDRGETPLHLVV